MLTGKLSLWQYGEPALPTAKEGGFVIWIKMGFWEDIL